MKLADNLSMHTISQVFRIWPKWTIYFGVTCLGCWKDHKLFTFRACWTQVSDRCPLGDLYFKKNSCEQTVHTLIRCRVLRHLIWVYTVCLGPIYWTLGTYRLRYIGIWSILRNLKRKKQLFRWKTEWTSTILMAMLMPTILCRRLTARVGFYILWMYMVYYCQYVPVCWNCSVYFKKFEIDSSFPKFNSTSCSSWFGQHLVVKFKWDIKYQLWELWVFVCFRHKLYIFQSASCFQFAKDLSWCMQPFIYQIWATLWENLFCHMRTIKMQISLCIRAVWSASLLFAA